MKVLANRYLFEFRDIMPASVDVDFFDPNALPGNISEYDALFVNTTTPLNKTTLPDAGNIRFAATGSSGTDHLDLNYLHSIGVTTANAKGCNAATVAEYVVTALLLASTEDGISLSELTVGIVGVGAVGSEVDNLLSEFSAPTVLYDPPRAKRDSQFTSANLKDLHSCDVLTFHTPLKQSGDYSTWHLFDDIINSNSGFYMLINAARGGVVDEAAATDLIKHGELSHLVLDTWENEPEFDAATAKLSSLATPHVAGYSIQSKRRATEMIISKFCSHAGIKPPEPVVTEPYKPELKVNLSSLNEVLNELHPMGWFDKRMRDMMTLDKSSRSTSFALLRSESPLRHEYTNIQVPGSLLTKYPALQKLGVRPL